jgi:hypothetical protein
MSRSEVLSRCEVSSSRCEEVKGEFDYQCMSDSDENTDALSQLYCDFCNYSSKPQRRIKCSECKHIACDHLARRVHLKTLGEIIPRWLCNTCLTHYANRCAQINSRRY